ncbi:hypothetical protein R1flu_011702 [Riccia fluitans]|uniref:Uncharacterized protein n=1 Tax=Riccia fluitans TaxID=41844 RepID=A0ABD1Z8I7_9MARC
MHDIGDRQSIDLQSEGGGVTNWTIGLQVKEHRITMHGTSSTTFTENSRFRLPRTEESDPEVSEQNRIWIGTGQEPLSVVSPNLKSCTAGCPMGRRFYLSGMQTAEVPNGGRAASRSCHSAGSIGT